MIFFLFLSFYHFEITNPSMILWSESGPQAQGEEMKGQFCFRFFLHHLFSNFKVWNNHLENLLKYYLLGSLSDCGLVHWVHEFAFLTSSIGNANDSSRLSLSSC